MDKNKKIQFYFIEDQDYENTILRDYKDYLYSKGHIINSLIIAKDITNKDQALIKLIDCNIIENKNENQLFIVCNGPLSMYLLNELNYLSFDGIITFDCSSLSSINLNDFSYFSKYATRKIDDKNWKTYFSLVSQSLNYLKNYFGAHYNLRKKDNTIKLYQIRKKQNEYNIFLYNKDSSSCNKSITTKGKFEKINDKNKLFEILTENL